MKRLLRAPSPAFVVSLIALFVALGGTTYAATNLPKNSVGAKQLKKNAVTAAKIKNGAVTATKINTHGLVVPNALHATSADSATSATSASNATHATSADSAADATHAASATSATNAANATHAISADTAVALGNITYAESAVFTSPGCGSNPCNDAFSDVFGWETCPAGTVVIGGGFAPSGGGVELNEAKPESFDTWKVFVDNHTPSAEVFTVIAICVRAQSHSTATASPRTLPRGRISVSRCVRGPDSRVRFAVRTHSPPGRLTCDSQIKSPTVSARKATGKRPGGHSMFGADLTRPVGP